MKTYFVGKKLSVLITVMLMAGCQHHHDTTHTPNKLLSPPTEEQMMQLSAITGSAWYVNEQCLKENKHSRQDTLSQVVVMAGDRGWSVDATLYQNLVQRSEYVFQQLSTDATPVSEKCRQLSKQVKALIKE